MFNQLLEKYHITQVKENNIGLSGDGVYHLIGEENYYLKISSNDEIINEVATYRFLKGKVNVPIVYEFSQVNDKYYLLMSEIKGRMLCDLLEEDIEGTIIKYATSLRFLHSIPYVGHPNIKDLKQIVEDIKPRLHLIDVDTLEESTKAIGIEKTYEKLCKFIPNQQNLVLCHGDYCMPNVIVGENIGFIDMGRSGVDDRYNDISLALRSLKLNLGFVGKSYTKEYENLFLFTYGIENIDEEKREFYYLLDEFF